MALVVSGVTFWPKAQKAPTVSPADLPGFIAPQLCETLDHPPSLKGWIHEMKFDGYRLPMRVLDAEVTLKTRKGHDWTFEADGRARRKRA
jgi:bifunctional non-homologous end joining protein LigD